MVNKLWHKYDDDCVTRISPEEVVSRHAYMLCYQRREEPAAAVELLRRRERGRGVEAEARGVDGGELPGVRRQDVRRRVGALVFRRRSHALRAAMGGQSCDLRDGQPERRGLA